MSRICHKTGQTTDGVHLYYGWFEAMHTRMDVMLVGITEARAQSLIEEAYAEIKRLEARLNRFDPRSDVARINSRECESWDGDSDAELVKLFSEAERYRSLSEGAFNIAIQTPDFNAMTNYYTIDNQSKLLTFHDTQAIFDFGGYAKGYALERVTQHLRVAGVISALISFGNSSVSAIGCHPTGKKWEVCVNHPTNKRRSLATVELEDCAMSTSGNTPDNRGHIKSSVTAEKVMDSKLITVKAISALDCEILSTALFAATGRDQQERIIANFNGAKFLEMRY